MEQGCQSSKCSRIDAVHSKGWCYHMQRGGREKSDVGLKLQAAGAYTCTSCRMALLKQSIQTAKPRRVEPVRGCLRCSLCSRQAVLMSDVGICILGFEVRGLPKATQSVK